LIEKLKLCLRKKQAKERKFWTIAKLQTYQAQVLEFFEIVYALHSFDDLNALLQAHFLNLMQSGWQAHMGVHVD